MTDPTIAYQSASFFTPFWYKTAYIGKLGLAYLLHFAVTSSGHVVEFFASISVLGTFSLLQVSEEHLPSALSECDERLPILTELR